MKKLLILLIAIFLSCSSDDDTNNITIENLTGEWIVQSRTVNDFDIDLSECDLKEKIIFKSNTNFTRQKSYSDNAPCSIVEEDYNYTLDDTVINIENKGTTLFYIGYVKNNNTIELVMRSDDLRSSTIFIRE
ncbi:lipocalin family protein [Joostella sp.]|uniref:lipocalin family protein n=1 Tax=Joostella sp. TaxID=2231138 RepID=UPI003A90B018